MSDADVVAQIRERDREVQDHTRVFWDHSDVSEALNDADADRHTLLAHVERLTARVAALEVALLESKRALVEAYKHGHDAASYTGPERRKADANPPCRLCGGALSIRIGELIRVGGVVYTYTAQCTRCALKLPAIHGSGGKIAARESWRRLMGRRKSDWGTP